MIYILIDLSLKSTSNDISYMVLKKKLKKCEANSESSELKNIRSELLTLKTLNLNNSEYTSHWFPNKHIYAYVYSFIV